MNKFNNVTSLIVVAVLAFTTGMLVLCFRSCRQGPEVKASLSAADVEVNESFTYSDSTHKARNWYWEFGDKGSSYKPRGTYKYKEPGTFKVRLTVNGKYEKVFTIQVNMRSNRAPAAAAY